MAAQLATAVTRPYGAHEIKLLYNQYLSFGLSFGIGLILFCTGIAFGIHMIQKTGSPGRDPIIIRDDIIVPPRIINTQIRPVDIPRLTDRPKNGVPTAVPDNQVDPNQTIPSQDDLSKDPGTVLDGHQGDIIVIPTKPPDENETDVPDWRPVEQEPKLIYTIPPVYPEIARRSEIEGKVIIKALVDKEGKIKKAIVVWTSHEIFNQSAIDAVMQYRFTPAMMNNGPGPAWVKIPFKYKLQ